MTTRQKGLLASLCLLLAACSSHPDAGSAGNWRGYTQTGLASYYADRYHNKRTASGEPYQRHANTAAHMTLPFGALVRVTNLANDKSVVVRVNDRGNFPAGASSISPGRRSAPSAIPDPGLSRSGLRCSSHRVCMCRCPSIPGPLEEGISR